MKNITNKDLEMMAYSLPWHLLELLPTKAEERNILIRAILETWEEVKEKQNVGIKKVLHTSKR